MSRKSTKNYSKLLGGLGAMYALSKLPVGEGVRPEDVNQEDAAADREATRKRIEAPRVDSRPVSEAAPPLTSRVVYKKGGVTRADGIAQRGKTRGKMY
jgi:hypothetical protein